MNLMRYYNQNRKKIWGILIIIAFVLLIFYLINYISDQEEDDNLVIQNNTDINSRLNTNTSTVNTNQSVITGEDVPENQLETAASVIDQFISYCNEKNLQSAYDLLTEECKTQMYNSLEVFEQAYYNNVFNGERKTCSIENWIGDTYKVRIIDNLLATGKSNNGYSKQDYITVKKVDGEYKLNINNYIGYTEINRETEQNDILVNVISKNTYMDYEEYQIKVTNNTDVEVKLDGRSNVKSLYIEDKNGSKYSYYGHEMTDPMLTIPSGQTKEVTIKFYSSYTSTKKIKYIVFSDVILSDGQITDKIEIRVNI